MQAKYIEQKRVLKLQCYKWVKFHRTAPEKAACPWGYAEINEACKNCRWFDIEKVAVNGDLVVTDREIQSIDVPMLADEYKRFAAVIDVQAAEEAIDSERETRKG